MEENARTAALATQRALDADAVRTAEEVAERSYEALINKQKRVDELEASMAEQRRLLTATNNACSSREAALNDATGQRLEAMQQDLNAVMLERDRLQAENERRRTTWGGPRVPAGAVPPAMAPEVMAMLNQQAEALRQTAQAQADAQRQSAETFQAMMTLITNMAQGAGSVAPPIITVVPTQTDAKKLAL